jgi:redox-sensitive bicupin YhaK (pirin superfamily)
MTRTVEKKVRGFRTQDGAGVSLVRVLGNGTVKDFDPILMLDSFDSLNPADYTAGFPMHPHRGIETISYVVAGKMAHRDSLGSEDAISDGEVQWMTAGSGIMHEEMIPAAPRLLGVQLWLNLPAADKMVPPAYHSIRRESIPQVELEGGSLRVLAGEYRGKTGFQGRHLPLDYYDVYVKPGAAVTVETKPGRTVMAFTLLGDAVISGEAVSEKTAVKLSDGEGVEIKSAGGELHVLIMSSRALNEPVAWGGPIVMNTQQELSRAFSELRNGTFLRDDMSYDK